MVLENASEPRTLNGRGAKGLGPQQLLGGAEREAPCKSGGMQPLVGEAISGGEREVRCFLVLPVQRVVGMSIYYASGLCLTTNIMPCCSCHAKPASSLRLGIIVTVCSIFAGAINMVLASILGTSMKMNPCKTQQNREHVATGLAVKNRC